MEQKDRLNDEAAAAAEQADNRDTTTDNAPDALSDEEAVTVNGGSTDEATERATPSATGELADLKDKYLRLYADFDNFRRRTAKEKLAMIDSANEKLLLDLLPVVDDFERALQSFDTTTTADVATLREGVQLIYNKLSRTLTAKGLKPMQAKGEPFDADLHESVTQFPAPSADLRGKVIDEIEKGYYLNDKVIRHAKVVVGS